MDLVKSPKLFFPTSVRFHETCMPQNFLFPSPIMKHMWTYPSSAKGYQKLIQSCKFFFNKSPILVINNLEYRNNRGLKYCNNFECNGFGVCCQKFDITKVKSKLWVTKELFIDQIQPNICAAFISKVYQCRLSKLNIYYQTLTYDDLKCFSKRVEKVSLNHSIVKYDDGEQVELENIVRLFSNSERFFMNFFKNPPNAVCKSYDSFIKACTNIENVYLHKVPNDFYVSEFYEHLKKTKNRVSFQINSCNPVQVIEKVIDEILSTESFQFVPPIITYTRPFCEKVNEMRRYQLYCKQHFTNQGTHKY